MLKIGDIVDNKYRILSEAGRGGMSIVYLAINDRANKTWAVKEVRKEGTADHAAMRSGIISEMEMMKKLRHPNLPAIVDVIDTEETFLIVMDYIEGRNLAELLREEGALEEERVLSWASQLADVLAYLHTCRPPIIYRDLKPSNIMVRPDDTLCLIDFGTARELKDRDMAEDTVCLGTRGYAAPEQFGGSGQSDERTDIYSFGATLYHLLTGHSPAEPPYEIKPPGFWIPKYKGSGLEKLILTCTRTDPDARYQNCAQLRFALLHHRDEDDAERKRQRARLAAFTVSFLGGLAALVLALAFAGAKERAAGASYENLLDQAMYAESLSEAKPFFLRALATDAGRALAYENLMEKTEAEILKEDRFTALAAQIVSECLTKRPFGTKTNLEALRAQDPEEYASLLYRLGLWYFFLKDNTDEDRQTAALNYFSRLEEDEEAFASLKEPQREMTRILARTGGYIGRLRTKLGKVGGNDESFRTLYLDLSKMMDEDLRSLLHNDYVCIALYQQTAYWIDTKEEDFLRAGVSEEDLKKLLKRVSDGLTSLEKDAGSTFYRETAEAAETIRFAEKTMASRAGS